MAQTKQRIQKFKHEICYICKCNNKQRNKLVKILPDQVIRAICDVIATIIYGKLGNKISEQNRKKLRRHKNKLLKLADKKTSLKKKRAIIQKGGGVLSSIGGFIDKILGLG